MFFEIEHDLLEDDSVSEASLFLYLNIPRFRPKKYPSLFKGQNNIISYLCCLDFCLFGLSFSIFLFCLFLYIIIIFVSDDLVHFRSIFFCVHDWLWYSYKTSVELNIEIKNHYNIISNIVNICQSRKLKQSPKLRSLGWESYTVYLYINNSFYTWSYFIVGLYIGLSQSKVITFWLFNIVKRKSYYKNLQRAT